jgi:hypothetical protein
MVAMSRAGSSANTSWGQNVWAVLCRAAFRGTDWGAAACGVKDTLTVVERDESAAGSGAIADVPERVLGPGIGLALGFGVEPIDWAKLDVFERGRVAREMGIPAPHHLRRLR